MVAVIPAGVRAVPLFDPARHAPPADAIDLQLRVPRSLQVLADDLARAGEARELMALQELVEGLVPELVIAAQKFCGRLAVRELDRRDGRIAVTPVVEGAVPGREELRPHVHLYLGATGLHLDTGEPAPVDFTWVREVANNVRGTLLQGLQAASDRFGWTWGWSSPSGLEEIVDPPGLAERGEALGFLACPGPWGPRRLILADESAIRLGAQSEARRQAEQANGTAWDPDYGVIDLGDGYTKATPEVVRRAREALGLRGPYLDVD